MVGGSREQLSVRSHMFYVCMHVCMLHQRGRRRIEGQQEKENLLPKAGDFVRAE